MTASAGSIHFVGIAGVGMSGLAEYLNAHGESVSGSDLNQNATTRRLAGLGIAIHQGHQEGNLGDARRVVASTAIAADNPELVEARRRAIPMIRRGQLLAEIMEPKRGIAVGGSHGKTTTTSLIGHLLAGAGLDPTSIVGGRVMGTGANLSGTRVGQSPLLVAEADESDGSFLLLAPAIAVITNIDPEHLDHYGSFEALEDAFVEFANAIPKDGLAVLCIDHPGVRAILPRLTGRRLTYGFDDDANLRASDPVALGTGSSFTLSLDGRRLGEVALPLPGRHNTLNALAAIAVGLELGIAPEAAARGLANFAGVERRYQALGTCGNIQVVDDYAHHPAELRATLEAARSVHSGRIVSVFQPHRYTRTRDCMDEFASAFGASDVVIISEVYPAGDRPIPGVNGRVLAEKIAGQGHGDVRFVADLERVRAELPSELAAGDLVLTLGAGDIARLGGQILERLADESGEGDA
ncbi:MAG: UDP-N-acetylmuramate--L-alanine ligase [Myxococcota bacterium]|nr:UDP-N-acetylmuramate--L-alanine ligase [Myxococcota bacterium]